jgi:hypothetical protein
MIEGVFVESRRGNGRVLLTTPRDGVRRWHRTSIFFFPAVGDKLTAL